MTDPIDALGELSKAGVRGGKYYRRVSTGNPKRPWRYYYTKASYDQAHGDAGHKHGPDERKTILTDAKGRPIEKPTPPGPSATSEERGKYLLDRNAWADKVSDSANRSFDEGFRQAMRKYKAEDRRQSKGMTSDQAEALAVTDSEKLPAVFDSLKSKQTIWVSFTAVMSTASEAYKLYVVGRKSHSKKYNVSSIALLPAGEHKPGRLAKITLMKRANGRVSLALGDMGTSLHGIYVEGVKKSENNMDPIDALGELAKAAGHKYKYRKMGPKGWEYTYETRGPKNPKQQKEHTKYEEAAEGHSSDNVRELDLYADNTRHLYNQSESIKKNLINKMAAGKYDHHEARKLWQYHADASAKTYEKEHGSPGSSIFSIQDRRQMAHDSAEAFLADHDSGDHDQHLQQQYKRKLGKSEDGMDPIDSLGELAKATGHKYKSRRRGKNYRWEYDYGHGYDKGKHKIISKKVDASKLNEKDIIQAASGPAEVESVSRAEGGATYVSYRYLDTGDYHERRLSGPVTVHLEHPAIGEHNAKQKEVAVAQSHWEDVKSAKTKLASTMGVPEYNISSQAMSGSTQIYVDAPVDGKNLLDRVQVTFPDAELHNDRIYVNVSNKKTSIKKKDVASEKYGEVHREKVGHHTVVVRKIFRARKGDNYHARVLRGAGHPSDEVKRDPKTNRMSSPGVLYRSDHTNKVDAVRAATLAARDETKKSEDSNMDGVSAVNPDLLSKGMHSFYDHDGKMKKIKADWLADYADAFFCEAYEHETQEQSHRDPNLHTQTANPAGGMAQHVYGEFIQMCAHNKNLMAAKEKLNVTPEYVEGRLRSLNLLHVDSENHEANQQASVAGYHPSKMALSQDGHALAGAERDAMVKRLGELQKGEATVQLAPGPNPMEALHNFNEAQRVGQAAAFGKPEPVKSTLDANCLFHGRDMHKAASSGASIHGAVCTCG